MKALVLCSGGLDSTTCLALAIEQHEKENVLALSIYYGQKHIREVESARAVAKHYGIELLELDLSLIFEGSDCALLCDGGNDIPLESYAEQLKKTEGNPVSTYVPFRNGLFLSAAASVAISHGCSVIYYGAHADDAAGNAYPDCSEAFKSAMNEAVFLGSGEQLRVEAPFIAKTKKDVVKEGLRLSAPYHLTWSCYKGGEKPCGLCGTCRDRAAAFAANGVSDPALEVLQDVQG